MQQNRISTSSENADVSTLQLNPQCSLNSAPKHKQIRTYQLSNNYTKQIIIIIKIKLNYKNEERKNRTSSHDFHTIFTKRKKKKNVK